MPRQFSHWPANYVGGPLRLDSAFRDDWHAQVPDLGVQAAAFVSASFFSSAFGSVLVSVFGSALVSLFDVLGLDLSGIVLLRLVLHDRSAVLGRRHDVRRLLDVL